jgi:hypothetical protein
MFLGHLFVGPSTFNQTESTVTEKTKEDAQDKNQKEKEKEEDKGKYCW